MASRINQKKIKSPDSNSQSIGDALTSGISKSVSAKNRISVPKSSARRKFLARLSATTAVAAATSLPQMQLHAAEKSTLPAFFGESNQRELRLLNIHTLEEIEIVYWENGKYLDDAVLRLSHHLRESRKWWLRRKTASSRYLPFSQ